MLLLSVAYVMKLNEMLDICEQHSLLFERLRKRRSYSLQYDIKESP